MKIYTKYISDYEYQSTTEEHQSVKIDMKKNGKTDLSPMQLVLSALTGCLAVEVSLMIKKRRKSLIDLNIVADAKQKETNPRGFTNIHLIFELTSPDAQLEELEKVAKLGLENYCSVADSLKSDITIEGKIIRPE